MAFQSSGMPMLGSDFGETPSGQPSLQFSVPCLEVTDQAGKPPSLNYLFYELPLPELPFAVTFFVANGWCNGKGTHYQRMKILNSDRTTALVETGKQDFTLKDAAEPFMAVNEFKQITFEKAGTYWFQVFLGDRKVLEYPITIAKSSKKRA
jgi:hypothetical protein